MHKFRLRRVNFSVRFQAGVLSGFGPRLDSRLERTAGMRGNSKPECRLPDAAQPPTAHRCVETAVSTLSFCLPLVPTPSIPHPLPGLPTTRHPCPRTRKVSLLRFRNAFLTSLRQLPPPFFFFFSLLFLHPATSLVPPFLLLHPPTDVAISLERASNVRAWKMKRSRRCVHLIRDAAEREEVSREDRSNERARACVLVSSTFRRCPDCCCSRRSTADIRKFPAALR